MTNSHNLKGIKILLAEDNMVNIMVAKQIFEGWGNHIDVATNGRAVLEMLESKEYDLILMDLQMPLMDGYNTSKQIRNRDWNHKNIPIIALSSSSFWEQKDKAIAAGMNDFICKPFRQQNLYSKILKYASA